MTWRLALLILCTALSAAAHDFWIEKKDDGYVVLYGHKYSAHHGEELIRYSPDFLRRIICVDGGGRIVERSPAGYPETVPRTCASIFVLASSGIWTQTAFGELNVPKNEADKPVKSWQSFDSVKRINVWNSAAARAMSNEIEIVPLNNPLGLKQGQKLRLLLQKAGKPIAGAVVTYDGGPRGTTGADGRINITIRRAGFQNIRATVSEPAPPELSGKADKIVHVTGINFEIQ